MKSKVPAFCIIVSIFFAAFGCGGNQETKTNDTKNLATNTKDMPVSAKSDFAGEWAEVVQKYPRVAAEFLKSQEALREGIKFARNTDEKAFKSSVFFEVLATGVCYRWDRERKVLVRTDCQASGPATPKDPQPGDPCRNCAGVCAAVQIDSGLARDCFDCQMDRAERGCL